MKIFTSIIFISISIASTAQTIKVKKETSSVKGEKAEGFEVDLDGSVNYIEDQLMEYLKPVGKGKKAGNTISISLPSINNKNYTSPIHAVVKDKGNTSAVWMGIRENEWPSETDAVKKELEKLVYDFGVNYHKEKIQRQIDESTRALQAVERQQQKLVNQNKDLNKRVEDNKKEKIELEKSLENNKVESEMLIKKIEKNKKEQDSVAIAGDQIKKVIEMQKDKQRKVN